MPRYDHPLKIPPVKPQLAPQNIELELGRHENAVAKEVVFAGKEATGFSLLEELEFEGAPLSTPLDRNLPQGRSRKHLLTERVALLGVRWLLEHRIFGSPVFHLSWHADSASYGLKADVSKEQLVGSVIFSTVDSLAERVRIAEDAVDRRADTSIELAIMNFEQSDNTMRGQLGDYRRVPNPKPEEFRQRNVVLVDIRSGGIYFYTN